MALASHPVPTLSLNNMVPDMGTGPPTRGQHAAPLSGCAQQASIFTAPALYAWEAERRSTSSTRSMLAPLEYTIDNGAIVGNSGL